MRWRRYLCSHPHILWQGNPKCMFLPLLPCSLPFRNTRFKKKGTCMVCWNGRPKESGHDTMKMFEIILLMGHWCSALSAAGAYAGRPWWVCWALLVLGVNNMWCACNLLVFVVLSFVLDPLLAAGVSSISSCNHFSNIKNIRENNLFLSSEQKHIVCSHCSSIFRVMCLQGLTPCHDVFSNIYVKPMVPGLITEAES